VEEELTTLRVTGYYQPDPLARHWWDKKKVKEIRVDLPRFYGKDDLDTFLHWEMKVEQLFWVLPSEWREKVLLATISSPIVYWNDFKSALRCN